MKRVAILGCSGSGKSTLARDLGAILNIDVFHLDIYYWQPVWVKPDPSEFERAISSMKQRDTWIIEGNYRAKREDRLQASDTIIYLRASPWRCAFRFLWRCWFERSRPDLPGGCREPVLNKEMVEHLRIIFNFRYDKEPQLLKSVRKHGGVKHLHELYGHRQVDAFIEYVRAARR